MHPRSALPDAPLGRTPHTIEFYMGVPMPEPFPAMGGEAVSLALAAAAVVTTGAALVAGSRRRVAATR